MRLQRIVAAVSAVKFLVHCGGTRVACGAIAAETAASTINASTLTFCFDFRKSRLRQLLIQRGKIGLE